MKFILGKKIEMTQVWQDDRVVAVTKVAAGPCPIVQVKTKGKDGYTAVQLGYGEKKAKNISKPQLKHFHKLKEANQNLNANIRYLREFRTDKYHETVQPEVKTGDVVAVKTFAVGDIVDVIGVSKGRGFQGVVKRHHFHGSKKTHGNKDQERMSGSVGPKGPAHVFKGTRMGGRMGGKRTTEKNLEIIGIDEANNILLIKGQVPGARNGLVMVMGRGELTVNNAIEPAAPATQPESVEPEVIAETEQPAEAPAEAKENVGSEVKSE